MKNNYRCRLALLALVVAISGCVVLPHSSDIDQQPVADLFLVSVEAQRAYRESRWIDAVRLYQTLVEQVPTDASAWFHLANTYVQQGAFQPAIHAYEQSLRFDSAQPKAWFNLSSVYLLNAQSAMRYASALMSKSDPARNMIADRLLVLDGLLHGRFGRRADLVLKLPENDILTVHQTAPK